MKIKNLLRYFLRDMHKPLVLLACIVGGLISTAASSVPPENTTKELFSFLETEKYKTRLGTQQELMTKWLSSELLTYSKIIECDAARARKEEERPLIYVDAEIFFDRWDTPMQCKEFEPRTDGGKQVVNIECSWGKGQDHREGETIQLFVYLVSEGSGWKVANIKHGRQEDGGNTKTDLIARMRAGLRQSSHPEYCANKFKK